MFTVSVACIISCSRDRRPLLACDEAEIIARTLSAKTVLSDAAMASDVPSELRQLLSRCLSKNQSDQPESMAAVWNELIQITALHAPSVSIARLPEFR